MTRTRRLVTGSAIAVLVVILAGAVVRASGSGLGCPHWPACFEESFFPPLSAEGIPAAYRESEHVNLQKTWTEWINRLMGFLGGLLLLAAAISAWIELRHRMGLCWLVTGAGFLYAFQGWQGAMVVKYQLDPRFVTVHLLIALTLLFLLITAAIALREDAGAGLAPAARVPLLRSARLLLLAGLVQFLLGALVRGTIELVKDENPALARSDWIGEVGVVDWLHRGLAFVVLALVFRLAFRLRAQEGADPLLRRAAGWAQLFVLFQLAAGLVLIEQDLRPAVQVLHIVLGSLLMGAIFVQERLLVRA